jgi:hypothetical protein
MKRTLTIFSAVVFAGAMALPAFAQVGAGVAGNATVGESNNHIGANADVANSDAERAEPTAPTDTSPTVVRRHPLRSENPTSKSPSISSDQRRGIDANAPLGSNAMSDTRLGPRANASTDDSPTGGY